MSRTDKKKTLRQSAMSTMLKFSGFSLVGVAFFYLLPCITVVYYSLVDNPIRQEFVALDNYVSLFRNESFRLAAANTLKFTCIGVLLQVILATLFSLIMECAIPAKSLLRTMLLSPLVVPAASVILVWQILFDDAGTINQLLENLGMSGVEWFNSSYSMVVIILLFTWKNLGYNMLIMINGLSSVPAELVESAKIDGAGEWRIFWKIRFRYIQPSLLFVTVMSVMNSYKIFREIYLLTGDYPTESLYFLQHYMNNMLHALDYQKLSAAAVIIALVVFLFFGIIYVLEGAASRDLEE